MGIGSWFKRGGSAVANSLPGKAVGAAGSVGKGFMFGFGQAGAGRIVQGMAKQPMMFLLFAMLIDGVFTGIFLDPIAWLFKAVGMDMISNGLYTLQDITTSLVFKGFNINFFTNQILYGGWIGIYNLFHFNFFFLFIIMVMIAHKDRPHPLRAWLMLILIMYLLSAIPFLNSAIGIRWGVELILLILFTIRLSFIETTKEDLIADVFVYWVFYNLYLFGVFNIGIGAVFHFIFFFLFYIAFCLSKEFKEDRVELKWWLIIMILADFFLPAILQNIYPTFPIGTLPFLFFGYLMFKQMYAPSAMTTVWILLVVTYFFFQLPVAEGVFQGIAGERQVDDEEIEERKNMLNIKEWFGNMERWTNESIYKASGQDYYASQVDQNAKEDLGVYIEGFESIASFWKGEEPMLGAVLTAQNFVSEEETVNDINVTLECGIYNKDKLVKSGEIFPRSKFTIQTYDQQNIQCVLPDDLEKGSYEIRLIASFTFETRAYLKKYFVMKSVVDSLRRKGTIRTEADILRLNEITDTEPITKNSVAPVQIKTSGRTPSVIKLDLIDDAKYLFGIKLQNEWKGKIGKIERLDLYFPDPITVSKCSPIEMDDSDPPESFEYDDYLYTGIPHGYSSPRLLNIEKDVEQRCWFSIHPTDVNELMDPGDVTTRYIRMRAVYNYILEEKANLIIKEETNPLTDPLT